MLRKIYLAISILVLLVLVIVLWGGYAGLYTLAIAAQFVQQIVHWIRPVTNLLLILWAVVFYAGLLMTVFYSRDLIQRMKTHPTESWSRHEQFLLGAHGVTIGAILVGWLGKFENMYLILVFVAAIYSFCIGLFAFHLRRNSVAG